MKPGSFHSIKKDTIRDGGSTALYAVYAVDMVYTFDTVDTVYNIQTVLHCLYSGMKPYIYC